MAELPAVPITLEGAAVLHQMFRVRWPSWRAVSQEHRKHLLAEAKAVLGQLEYGADRTEQTAVYSQLGHKGDLLLMHLRPDFETLHQVELELTRLELFDYFELKHSYLSVVELGLYESTAKTYGQLAEAGSIAHSPEWNAGVEEVVSRQSAAMRSRLYPAIPSYKYICFYPMDRKRGEDKNWYQVSMAERQRMMHEHGMIGRRYADSVRQIITGSIGFDDWEWGVTLFSGDPIAFKKLIYEMRFDEVSAVYAIFGAFYFGLRVEIAKIDELLSVNPAK